MSDICQHFTLSQTPCTREVSTASCWRHPLFDQVRADLLQVLSDRQSAALLAPAGAGKTTLTRLLCEDLPEARYRVHYVKVTSLSKRDFCRELCRAVDARSAGTFNAAVQSLQERMLTLTDQDGLRPVLIIDEAHDMRPEVLATLRILTNFEMDSRLVVSFLLVGQPPLRHLLRRQELESVARRLAHFATLRLLDRGETTEYIQHRLHIVGADRPLFSSSALDTLYENAGGNLRATNRLALKSLQVAAQEAATLVESNHVISARNMVLP